MGSINQKNYLENQQQITAQSEPSWIDDLEELQQADNLAIDDWEAELATLSEEELEKLMEQEHKTFQTGIWSPSPRDVSRTAQDSSRGGTFVLL